MITMFRLKVLFRETTYTYAKSKPWLDIQKRKFWHGFSSELNMDARIGIGRGNAINRKKGKQVTQAWRAVSTQPDLSEGDGERVTPQNQLEEVLHGTSSTVSVAECEDSNIAGVEERVGPDTGLLPESGKIDTSMDVNLTTPNKHTLSMEIGGSPIMRYVKGKWGTNQKKIEAETGVKIIFPFSKEEESIILEGNSAESISQASEKIQTLIDQAVNSQFIDYSHFVSLPLAIHPELLDKLFNFQNTILGVTADDKDENTVNDAGGDTVDKEENHPTASRDSVELKVEKADAKVEVNINDQRPETPAVAEVKADGADRQGAYGRVRVNIPLVSYAPKEPKASESKDAGIVKSMFIKPQTFHLTVVMLKLWNKGRVKAASEVLQSVSSKIKDALEDRPLLIRLKGVKLMKGSKDRALVLYAPVEEIGAEGRLLRACQVITDAFAEAGLLVGNDAKQQLKLHATLINARHRKRQRTKGVEPFDATDIFEKYGNEEWGEYDIREAHLSQRYAYDENGFYHCCASIPFPQKVQVD